MTVIHPQQTPTLQGQKEYVRTVTAKGQVTIPAAIRVQLGVKAQGEVVFRMQGKQATVEPVAMTLEEAFGSVKPVKPGKDYKAIRDQAIEEHVQKVISEMNS